MRLFHHQAFLQSPGSRQDRLRRSRCGGNPEKHIRSRGLLGTGRARGYTKSPEEYVRENKKLVTGKEGKERVSVAAILLLGKNPQQFFPRAFIRFIRYDGTEAKVGKDMNVVKDVIFEGRILEQVEKAVDFIKIQMKEKTFLGHDGIFVTEAEYSEFVRTEIVDDAATHRDYGIKGTDIQIKMFDDRLEVDSPGTFAGMVRKENIRYTHFPEIRRLQLS